MNKLLFLLPLVVACTQQKTDKTLVAQEQPKQEDTTKVEIQYHDTTMVKLSDLSDLFVYDMKYATDDNFLKKTVYECTNCLVRYQVAKALIVAAREFQQYGYKIKFFDCTRPVEVQKQMWEIMPDARYVANPYKSGSIHNRGAAVDITLVDESGEELDMGTAFDHFGKEAHHAYTDISDEVKTNRLLLKKTMESAGFLPIKTEWWHYNFGVEKFNITKVPLCD